jgi:hypothetical protein
MKPKNCLPVVVFLSSVLVCAAQSMFEAQAQIPGAPVGAPVPTPQTALPPVAPAPANAPLPTPPAAAATSFTIGWTPSPSTNIVSQTVAWGTAPTNYTQFTAIPVNQVQFQLTGLTPATTYYVAVLCTQGVGSPATNFVKSQFGNEVVWTTNPSERPVPPQNNHVVSAP